MLLKKDDESSDLKWRLVGLLGKLFIDGLFIFSPYRVAGYQKTASILNSGRYIMAFWHSRILFIAYRHKGKNAAILVSDSADGEIIAQIIKRQGHLPVRGSTGKGGVRALARLISLVKQGHIGAVVPDGPQGPRYKVQPGVILLAAKTGLPIIPASYSAKHRKVFASWDRFIMPLPGSPGLMIYGKPVRVPNTDRAAVLEGCRRQLENELNRITALADGYFGHEVD